MTTLLSVADWGTAPRDRPPKAAVLLLGSCQVLAFLFLLTVAVLPNPALDDDRSFNVLLAMIAALIAAVTFVVAPRSGFWLWDSSFALSVFVLAGPITWTSSATGQMLNGGGLIVLGMVAALFSSRARLTMHLVWLTAVYLTSIWLTDRLPSALYALMMVLMTGLVAATTFVVVQQLRTLSEIDPLTSALNRRGLEDRATSARGASAKAGRSTVVGMLDLDEFKAFNDREGHLAGDDLLRSVVAELVAGLRSTDLVARYGGDEFVVVLPDSDEADADAALARICSAAGTRFTWGLTTWRGDESLWSALDRADHALYVAKRARRTAD